MPTTQEFIRYGGLILLALVILQSWDGIVTFFGIILTAIIPLLLGAAIAYVVSIPTDFFERHLLPNSTSKYVVAMRRPVSLVIATLLMLVAIFLASSVFVPAFIETISMARDRAEDFLSTVLQIPIMQPFKPSVEDFLHGEFMQKIMHLDVLGMVKDGVGGSVGTISTQVFGVVSTLMTGFFGLLFSFILLTDTTGAVNKATALMGKYLGAKRADKIKLFLDVADSSFHNFIVRQFLEAAILGSVGTITLLVAHYDYALGVGVFMALAALVPIVGYPVGLIAGAFMVAISNLWIALLYLAVVAFAQMLEATFVLPHVGDPRTALPPVWTTVAVTIGGGVAGFVGMLVAIPTAATIRQLILVDATRRGMIDSPNDDAPEEISSELDDAQSEAADV